MARSVRGCGPSRHPAPGRSGVRRSRSGPHDVGFHVGWSGRNTRSRPPRMLPQAFPPGQSPRARARRSDFPAAGWHDRERRPSHPVEFQRSFPQFLHRRDGNSYRVSRIAALKSRKESLSAATARVLPESCARHPRQKIPWRGTHPSKDPTPRSQPDLPSAPKPPGSYFLQSSATNRPLSPA